ncbi:rplL [Scenedesmus sp. PABB004]|nr:rplL [Scenedesmus sp. PABB004]
MSQGAVALSRWLVVVAGLRLLSVYIGLFDPGRFRTALIDLQPGLVNDLYGRLFATWTVLTCGLCLICARNPTNAAIYGATLLSFVVALTHFATELLVFKTMSLRGAAAPMVIAGLSTLWMGAGWNYYTLYSNQQPAGERAAASGGHDNDGKTDSMRLALLAAARAAQQAAWAPGAPGGACARLLGGGGSRALAAAAGDHPADDAEAPGERVQQLAQDIMSLSVLECSQLSNLLREKLGVPRGAAVPMMAAAMAAPPPAAGAAPEADAAPPAKEKTEFDVKLESFTPEGKIKVIKEIRALTALGLKEAKELVEKAPVVIKTGVSKADAEAMQKQLEAVGGKVVME